MDYQRPHSLNMSSADSFQTNYTNVTAYNFGVVSAAAGISLISALNGAGFYNQHLGNPANANTAYGLNAERVVNIAHGYNDYVAGSWKK